MKRLLQKLEFEKYRKAGKYVLMVIFLLALIWVFTRKVTSKEAFINASITQISSPIPGTLILNNKIYPGSQVKKSQVIGQVNWNQSNSQITQLRTLQLNTEYIIAGLTQQLIGNQNEISARQLQLKQYLQETNEQRKLEVDYNQAQYQQVQSEEIAAKQQALFASNQLKRAISLHQQGYLSQAGFERQRSDAESLLAEAQARQAEGKQKLLDIQAAHLGLQLSGPRTLDGPNQSQRDIKLVLVDLIQTQSQLIAQKDSAQRNLISINHQLQLQQHADIRSTLNGVVWAINTRNGSSINSNNDLIDVINCQDSWVEAFFDESDAAQLQPGKKVTISLSPSDSHYGQWKGIIESVRAGTGRVDVGGSVVMPPPEIARRQLPVKVVTARIRVEWKSAMQGEKFCLAGRSVSVSL